MVFGLVILELYVEALLNAHLHLDRIVHLWVGGQRVYSYRIRMGFQLVLGKGSLMNDTYRSSITSRSKYIYKNKNKNNIGGGTK